jgi:hypothetical protein
MDSVTLYNVYVRGNLLASFKAQAPATSFAKNAAKYGYNSGKEFEVIEEVFGHVSSRPVRYIVDGKIHKCS